MAEKTMSKASTSGSAGGGGNVGRGESLVIDVGRRKSTCGYCKSGARTSVSHGLWAESLTVDDYQALLDRGWRRSGCFLYKPDMQKTCCPSYTIRLKASDFVASREQTRVSKKMQRFLEGTLDVKKFDKLTDTSEGSCSIAHSKDKPDATMKSSAVGCDSKNKADQTLQFLSDQVDYAVKLCVQSQQVITDIQLPKASVRKVASGKRKLQAEVSEELVFSSNVAFQVAAALKRSKKDVENGNLSADVRVGIEDSNEISPKAVAEILACHLRQLETCGLSVRACNGHINFYSALKEADAVEVGRDMVADSYLLSNSINDKGLKKKCENHQGKRRRLEILLKRSSFDSEEYSLYRKYQLQVHNDTPDHVTESSYKRFLVDTPLVYVEPTDDGDVPPCGFGSFHQQYVVDGKLIAVGVIDILPKCLSSKYLFWDPDFAYLSLGKYSALQEIQWVHENQVHCPSLQYYYLGYYIHSCSKMRYKAAYQPSELLCPLHYQWVLYDIAKPLLDRQKYVVLSDWRSLQGGESLSSDELVCDKEKQQIDYSLETSNDEPLDKDEMDELDSGCSDDDEPDSEGSTVTTVPLEDIDLSNVLLGLRGSRFRYRDLRHAFDPRQREFLENQLRRFIGVVGTDLSKQMVYSLG